MYCDLVLTFVIFIFELPGFIIFFLFPFGPGLIYNVDEVLDFIFGFLILVIRHHRPLYWT